MSLGDFDLIVTCEECSTSFQLDEARIPASGARVRCSRCKHAFFLPNPSASQPEAVHSIAEDAAAEPDSQVPAATDDLSSPSQTATAEVSAPPSSPEPDLDEEDWQFSEEVRVEGDEDRDEPLGNEFDSGLSEEPGGESAFGETQDFGAGFDESALSADTADAEAAMPPADAPAVASEAASDAGTVSGLELDSPPEPEPAPSRDESSFGSVDDFSSLMDDEEPAPAVDLASEIAAELREEAAAEANTGTYSESGPTDDLGDPESWDLVGSDDFAVEQPSVEGVSRSFTGGTGIGPVDAGEFFSEDGSADSDYDDDLAPSWLMAGPVVLIGRTVGWAASAALVGAVLFLALQSEWARWAQAPQTAINGSFQAETISSGWVETSRAGAILRFEGMIRNTGSQPIWPGVVQLALLDAAGQRLTAPPVQAGAPVASSILREAPSDVLDDRVALASRRLFGTPLAPGEARPFEALVREDELPDQAHRVLLEVGESRTALRRAAPVDPPAEPPAAQLAEPPPLG